jgi:hypothetical protein
MREALARASPERRSDVEMPPRKALELASAALAYRCHRQSGMVRKVIDFTGRRTK